jgi:hypothetical protein
MQPAPTDKLLKPPRSGGKSKEKSGFRSAKRCKSVEADPRHPDRISRRRYGLHFLGGLAISLDVLHAVTVDVGME